jgi:hypothetical protein
MNTNIFDTFDTSAAAVVAAQAEAADSFDYVEFDGMNCNDYGDDTQCGGWDGSSHRCGCGNRRVSWSTMQNSDGRWSAYAEAY